MSEVYDESNGGRAAEILDRFLASHPGGSEEQFEAWAASQPELKSDPELRSGASKLLQDWLRAEELLQLGMEFDDGGSVFRRRSGAPRDLPAQAPGSEALREGRRIGSFILTRFIAKGGMGQVWEAEDTELRRKVALKLVLPDRIDERSQELFAREARAGGRLNHPNLVTTLAYGTDDGLSWIAQELVEGSWTIKDSLDALRAEDAVPKNYYREVAELVAKIADGMQAVHDAGVIHRDLKPQNILIAEDDTPKVTDFGLARVIDDSVMSQTGDFAGTWAYMSPEQVTAKRMGLDHRTDIFSLGVVMYELLTLRKPFEGDTTHQIAQEIIYADPPEATKVRSQCPRELSVIAGKAIEKVPGSRYGSIDELAADLRRHLANEPVLAKPPGALARGAKWVRRHPATSLAGAITSIALVAVSLLSLNLADRTGELTETTVALRGQTKSAGDAKRLAEERAEELATANRLLEREQAALQVANAGLRAAQEEADARADEAIWQQYVAILSHAAEGLERGDTHLVRNALQRAPLESRGWAWNYLHQQAHQELAVMPEDGTGDFQVAFAASPNGQRAASADLSRLIQVWDVAKGQEVHRMRADANVLSLHIGASGDLLLSGHQDGSACIWDLGSGELARRIPAGRGLAVNHCAIAEAAGRILLARSDGSLELHNLDRPGLVATSVFDSGIALLESSANGSAVAVVHGDRCTALNLSDGEARFEAAISAGSSISFRIHLDGRTVKVAYAGLRPNFSADGRLLVLPQGDGAVVVHATDGKVVFRTPAELDIYPVAARLVWRDEALMVCTSSGAQLCWNLSSGELEVSEKLGASDLRLFAISGDGQVVWIDDSFDLRVHAIGEAERLVGHTNKPTGLRFSADGEVLFSHDKYGTRAWRTHRQAGVADTALAPDRSIRVTGRRLIDPASGVALGELMGRVAFQDLETVSEGDGQAWKLGAGAGHGAFSSDSRHYLALVDGGVGWWTSWGRLHGTLGRGGEGGYTDAASIRISPDSRHVAALCDLRADSMASPGQADFGVPTGTRSGSLRVWSLEDGEEVLVVPGGLHDFAFLGDGAAVAVARRVGGVSILRLDSEGAPMELPAEEPVLHVASVGSDRLLIAYESGRLTCVNAEDGSLVSEVQGAGQPRVLAVSPGHERAFSASYTVGEVWSLPSLERVGEQVLEKVRITSAAFHPIEERLAIGTKSGTIRVLCSSRGDPLLSLRGDRELVGLGFEPDGHRLVGRTLEGNSVVWSTRPQALLSPGVSARREVLDDLFNSSSDLDAVHRALESRTEERPLERVALETGFRQRAAAVVDRARRLLAGTFDPLEDPTRWQERVLAESKDQLAVAEAIRTVKLLRTHPYGINQAAWKVVARPGAPKERVALAVSAMERALEAQPGESNYLNTLGVAHYRAGHFSEAVEVLRRADERPDQQPLDAGYLALALRARGELQAAAVERARFAEAITDPRWAEDEDIRQVAVEIAAAFELDDD